MALDLQNKPSFFASPSATGPRPGEPPRATAPAGVDLKFSEPGLPTGQTGLSAPTPKTPALPARPGPSAPQELRTSLRTMADDISKLKVGQTPTGVDVQKTITGQRPTAPPPFIPQSGPSPIRPPAPGLPPTPRPPSPPPAPKAVLPPLPVVPSREQRPAPTPMPQVISPPSRRGAGRRVLFLLLLAVLLGGAVFWLFLPQEEEIAEVTPTPERTATPTPIRTLRSIFGVPASTITLSASGNPASEFSTQFGALTLSSGELRPLSVTSATKAGGDLTMLELFDRLLISYPADVRTTLGTDALILAYGQREAFDARGTLIPTSPVQKRLIFVTEVRDAALLTSTMRTWEAAMTNALASLLNFVKSKAASPLFLDNIYRGTSIRYRNFAFADSTMDYAIATDIDGKQYLFLTNSREAIYRALDRLGQ